MPKTYYLTNTVIDAPGAGDKFERALLASPGTADFLSLLFVNGYSNQFMGLAVTPVGDPGTDGTSTGVFTLTMNITATVADLSMRAYLVRAVGSTHAATVESAQGSVTLSTTGIYTFTWTNPALGAWSAGDRLLIRLGIVNASAHGGDESLIIQTDVADSKIVTPFTGAAGGPVAIEGVVDGIGEVAGDVSRTRSAEATIDGIGEVAGDITVTGAAGGSVEIEGVVDAVGEVAGAAGVERAIRSALYLIDAGDSATPPADFIDAGDSATPPTEFIDPNAVPPFQDGIGELVGDITVTPAAGGSVEIEGTVDGVGEIVGDATTTAGVTPKTSGFDPVDKSTYTTAPVTIGGPDKVALVAVLTINASSPNSPTLSGPTGVDWAVARDFFFDQVSTFRKLTVFAGTAPSPTTGAITIDYAGQNQATVLWSVVGASGINTGTAKGVVQSAQNQASGTALTVTLPNPIGDPANLAYGVFANGSNTTFTPGEGLIELHDLNASPETADGTLHASWKIAGTDTTIDATSAVSDPDLAGVALELLAGTTTGTQVQIVGAVEAVAELAGAVARDRPAAAAVDGVAELAGAVIRDRAVAGALEAIGELVGDVSIAGRVEITGTVDGVAELAGTVIATRTITGAVDAIGELAGEIARAQLVAAVIDAVGELVGEITVTGPITFTAQLDVTVSPTRLRARATTGVTRTRAQADAAAATRLGAAAAATRSRAKAEAEAATRSRVAATLNGNTRNRAQVDDVESTRLGLETQLTRV